MERQNITLSLPKDILKKAKVLAVKKGTSVSGLLTRVLEELVEQDDRYQADRVQHLNLLEAGGDLGTQGSSSWTREDLRAR